MRAFAWRATIFLGTLLLSLGAVDRSLAALVTDAAELKYQAMLDARLAHPHIVLGTSHAELGINPRHIEQEGFSLYNFAFSGSNPRYLRHWYELFRSRRPAPSLVLLSADWFLFKPSLDRQFEQDSEYWPVTTFARSLLFTPELSRSAMLLNRFPLVKERQTLQQLFFPQERGGRFLIERYYKGYVPVEVQAFRWMEPERGLDHPARRADFERLLERLEADDVQVVFFQAPEHLPTAGEHPVENEQIAAIARDRGIPFLNYNTDRRSAMNLEKGYFIDWGHLNERGSEIFSRRLAEDLRALGVIPSGG